MCIPYVIVCNRDMCVMRVKNDHLGITYPMMYVHESVSVSVCLFLCVYVSCDYVYTCIQIQAHVPTRSHTSMCPPVYTRLCDHPFTPVCVPTRLHPSMCPPVYTRLCAHPFTPVYVPTRLHPFMCVLAFVLYAQTYIHT